MCNPNNQNYFAPSSVGEYVECGSGVIERSGEGSHSFATGLVYKGTWSNDKMNGIGMIFMYIQRESVFLTASLHVFIATVFTWCSLTISKCKNRSFAHQYYFKVQTSLVPRPVFL